MARIYRPHTIENFLEKARGRLREMGLEAHPWQNGLKGRLYVRCPVPGVQVYADVPNVPLRPSDDVFEGLFWRVRLLKDLSPSGREAATAAAWAWLSGYVGEVSEGKIREVRVREGA